MSEHESELGNGFGENLAEQIFTLWVDLELERRGLPVDRSTINKVLVTFSSSPEQSPVISINEEVKLKANVRLNRDLQPGEEVAVSSVDEIEGIEPVGVDPNSGWIAAYVLPNGEVIIQFDYRYNKEEAGRSLALAREYLTAAQAGLAELPRPAMDNLYSAAELSVHALMLIEPNPTTKKHWVRADWHNNSAKLQNVPSHHPGILKRLHRNVPWPGMRKARRP
ncbi:hypothetical protein [Paenarthrobacter aromaticivorans]|uniref:Uncharacterized protein n=1 Tax=Paenarthrobacter aromaticivorans TaxID=2849150 RepID=A0ABS6I8Z3_9MICC|nr:hypothetical protein [Paenarthrobacter sp. MMS21-TAE1-1]MBU8867857.1 hypothetical protein [Paenarthrobacter sp. MMS21-TAE1-1]